MDIDRITYSLALSVVSSPALNGIWDRIDSSLPQEIFEMLNEKSRIETQAFLCGKYSYNPLDAAKEILEESHSGSINIVDYWDREYPSLLREIPRPPLVLYSYGKIRSERSVAIVGTRKPDEKSREIARRIARELSQSGYTIVSGMAIGIDREAHAGALGAGGGTIGVLANGIDVVYPYPNRDIYKTVKDGEDSALVSEYPPGILAGRWTFVRRNRIISGLSLGTVVVQAVEKSGALITARHALEQNREVFSCPGYALDVNHKGNHHLIQNGALLVSDTKDIIEELASFNPGKSDMCAESNTDIETQGSLFDHGPFLHDSCDHENSLEKKIIDFISGEDGNIDAIIRGLGVSPGDVLESLVVLELSGRIVRKGNNIRIL